MFRSAGGNSTNIAGMVWREIAPSIFTVNLSPSLLLSPPLSLPPPPSPTLSLSPSLPLFLPFLTLMPQEIELPLSNYFHQPPLCFCSPQYFIVFDMATPFHEMCSILPLNHMFVAFTFLSMLDSAKVQIKNHKSQN